MSSLDQLIEDAVLRQAAAFETELQDQLAASDRTAPLISALFTIAAQLCRIADVLDTHRVEVKDS